MLRCLQLGISIADLDLLSIGLVTDMYIESANDNAEEDDDGQREAAQHDFDRF